MEGDPQLCSGGSDSTPTPNHLLPMKRVALLFASVVLAPLPGSAALIYGLTSTNGLVSFDSASPGTVTTIGTISQAGIMDIDFYPVNGVL